MGIYFRGSICSRTLGNWYEITRVDDYAKHLKNTRSLLPDSVRYLVADGYYCRAKFWDAVGESDLNLIRAC
jgi:hypothetical protein